MPYSSGKWGKSSFLDSTIAAQWIEKKSEGGSFNPITDCDFHYISEGIPSLMRFWLLLSKSAADTIEHIFKSDHVPLKMVSFHFR